MEERTEMVSEIWAHTTEFERLVIVEHSDYVHELELEIRALKEYVDALEEEMIWVRLNS